MKATLSVLLAAIVIGAIALGVFKVSRGNEPKAPPLRYVVVDRGPVSAQIRVTGVAASNHAVDVAAQVSGRADAVLVELGGKVAKGDPLVRIGNDEAVAENLAREASLRQTEADVVRRQGELDAVKHDWEAGGEALEKVKQAEAQLQADKSQRDRARAELDLTRMRLQRHTISAGVAGTVTALAIHPGEYVQAGKLLLTLTEPATLEVLAKVEPSDAPLVRPGMAALVSIEGAADATSQERVLRIEPTVRKEAGAEYLGVWISLTRGKLALLPNQQVDVKLLTGSRDSVLRLPLEALVTKGGKSNAWIVSNGKLAPQPIETGVVGDRYAEILSGLVAGQSVVVTEGAPLVEGAAVRAAASDPQR